MKLSVIETDDHRTLPPYEAYSVAFGEKSKPLYVGTKQVRLYADDDCLVSMDGTYWWRLAADIPEWFVVTASSPRPCIWVKAEPDET